MSEDATWKEIERSWLMARGSWIWFDLKNLRCTILRYQTPFETFFCSLYSPSSWYMRISICTIGVVWSPFGRRPTLQVYTYPLLDHSRFLASAPQHKLRLLLVDSHSIYTVARVARVLSSLSFTSLLSLIIIIIIIVGTYCGTWNIINRILCIYII